MPSTPVRYPSGVATRPTNHIFGNFPRPDKTQIWEFFDDFNGFVWSRKADCDVLDHWRPFAGYRNDHRFCGRSQ